MTTIPRGCRPTRRKLLCAAGSFAFVALGNHAAGAQPTLEVIRVTVTPPVDVTPFFYAVQQKMFEQAGLDIRYQQVTSGQIGMTAVAGGAADVAFGNTLSIATAFEKRIPIEVVAAGGLYLSSAPTVAMLALPETMVKNGKDLEGRIVGVPGLHDLLAIAVRAWTDANGGDSTKVRFLELPQSSEVSALQAKRLDAIGAYEPFLSQARAAGAQVVGLPYDAIAKEFGTAAWFANTGWIKGHRDAALRFGDVIRQSSAYVEAHYDELIPLMSSFSKVAEERIRNTPHVHFPRTLTPALLQPVIDVAAKYGEIKARFPAQAMMLASG